MFQIIKPVNSDSGLVEVKYLNNVGYTHKDLKLFAETTCVELKLESLKKFLEINDYNSTMFKRMIESLSQGKPIYQYVDVTESARKYHEALFDVLYIKKLRDLPLMINGDPDIVPVVKWRFKIAK